jgi:hypothetical protein
LKLLELIKQNAVPAAVMRSAAKGALSVPTDEMLEVLVYLTNHPIFGTEAKMTLAGWDEKSAIEVLSKPDTPRDVLDYFWAQENRRLRLMPALIENPAINERELMELASVANRAMVDVMMSCPRVRDNQTVWISMEANPNLSPTDVEGIQPKPTEAASPAEEAAIDPATEEAHRAFQEEHAGEIAAEQDKAFELVDPDDSEKEAALAATVALTSEAEQFAAEIRAMPVPPEQRKLSALQKITRMTVAERIKTAFGGDKEERSILIRDTSKIVQNAVLSSPRLTDPEVETFAAAKSLQENVLREIARRRKFIKSYPVVRNLVNNPRCPLDLSLTLIKNLLVTDLYNLQYNKNVPDTIRKVAMKLYMDKKQVSHK